jgi:hypothetical protein
MHMLKKSVPFLLVLLILLGSLVVSCATSSSGRSPDPSAGSPGGDRDFLSINTGRDIEGNVYTIQVFSRIDKIIVVNRMDRSKKTELKPGDWVYEADTTAIRFTRDPGYKDLIVHVEGVPFKPVTFILPDFQGGDEDLFVVLDKRLALKGFDFTFDRQSRTLTFREDIDPEKAGYLIRYQTSSGSNGLGNWTPGKGDELAYLEAQHNADVLRRWYESQDGFYFFEKPVVKGEVPSLVKRPATPAEMGEMLNIPVTVMKSRFEASDKDVSREVGFDVSTPKALAGGIYESWGKTVEETSADGRLKLRVNELYRRRDAKPGDRDEILMILSAEDFPEWKLEDEGLLVSDSIVDLGKDVRKRVVWGTSGGLYGKPSVVKLVVYTWKDATTCFEITSDESESVMSEQAIREIIAFRKS